MKFAVTLIFAVVSLSGFLLLIRARVCSEFYNAWTTRIRELQNRAPTPKWRRRNTAVTTWILRCSGVCLFLSFGLAAIGAWFQ
jgi:hypothetical protein